MPPLPVMFKTVSADCNLDCSYCYYQESNEHGQARHRLDEKMLEAFVPQYMAYVADAGVASLAWQGGEPTLMGRPFFERVVALQAAHARPGTKITNVLQTNATLLDDAWGSFLRRYNWLVGVSLDGPGEIHDLYRKDRGGRGSFDRVMQGINVLRRHGVEFNILCVLGPHNVNSPKELLRFYRAQGFSHVQFIPAMDFQASDPQKPPAYLITPEQYASFLITAFDDWYENGAPGLSVRIFDNFLQNYVGMDSELCVHNGRCDAGIVVEHDGSAYPCDFFIHPRWKLGDVASSPLAELANSQARQDFINQKTPVPAECAECRWLTTCKGGCPRNRLSAAGPAGPDYFCLSYRRLFEHAEERLNILRTAVHNKWRYLDRLDQDPRIVAAANRNDPCPCGSGKKLKQCCQSPARLGSYLFSQ